MLRWLFAIYFAVNADEMQGMAPTIIVVAISSIERVMTVCMFCIGSIARRIARTTETMMAIDARL